LTKKEAVKSLLFSEFYFEKFREKMLFYGKSAEFYDQ